MGRQAIFNKVVRHLAKQGGPARNDVGACKYLAEDGRKCAIGSLIPKAQYNPMMEGSGVRTLYSRYPGCVPGVTYSDMPLMGDLQLAHDIAPQTKRRTWLRPWAKDSVAYSLFSAANLHGLKTAELVRAFGEPPKSVQRALAV